MRIDDVSPTDNTALSLGAADQSVSSVSFTGLASMYQTSDSSIVLRAIMDIGARASSLAERPRDKIQRVADYATHRPTQLSGTEAPALGI
jgi:hypothetical protein